jgi:hypothetical protein
MNLIRPYAWLMAWQWQQFLRASYPTSSNCGLYMTHHVQLKIITYCICHVTLNQTQSHKFEKWCKFSSHIKVKSIKEKLHRRRPACIVLRTTKTWPSFSSIVKHWTNILSHRGYQHTKLLTGISNIPQTNHVVIRAVQ